WACAGVGRRRREAARAPRRGNGPDSRGLRHRLPHLASAQPRVPSGLRRPRGQSRAVRDARAPQSRHRDGAGVPARDAAELGGGPRGASAHSRGVRTPGRGGTARSGEDTSHPRPGRLRDVRPTPMTAASALGGVYPIVPTIFDGEGNLDDAGQRATIDFLLRAGVHGMVLLANASEGYAVCDAERTALIASVIRQVNGRVPVVVTCNQASTAGAVRFAREAEDLGADAVMFLPPFFGH